MIKFLKAAIRGVKAELAAGESGWVTLSATDALSAGGYASHAGKSVSPKTAMEVSAVWDCVRKTSEVVSTLPASLYERQADGSKVRIDNDLSDILTRAPNTSQTATEFWEGGTAQTVLRGNGYSERLLIKDRLVGLRPLFNVTPKRLPGGGFSYRVVDRGKSYEMPASKVFHLRGFGPGDGLGMSAIAYGANSIGAALAADETAGSVFSNMMMAAAVLESDQGLSSDQRDQLQEMLSTFVGSKKAGKTLVLEAGLKHRAVQMNPEDAQLLETRQFGVEDVCRWFGVPPIVIGHAPKGQTMWGSGVEAIMLSWLTLGINPLLKRIEARIAKDLIPPSKRGKWVFEWNREGMLQMDSKAKGEFLSKMGSSGTMTANERRSKLNLPPHDDPAADSLTAQSALVPLEDLGKDKT
ncbi:phage portal protein [Shimia sagamensis]|uniref:Phage portal protein, HK97 family n=1 Tax=Shimia sagamensis TaxID=1566352 RepID=A0ABY1PGI8_9RHOB|nr:phage portal protein [Shimia sagamensis]SMP32140.1 phage portal protein, HK97 family [Shimia sagamensis]